MAVTDLATRRWGEGRPSLVLLHGWIGSTADWSLVAPDLAVEREVLAVDHRGHGASPHAGDYRFDVLLADFDAWAERQVEGPFDLVGHSMGGVVAMQYALARPDRVRSLLLVDTAAAPTNALPMDLIEGLADLGRSSGMAAVREAIGAATADLLDYEPPRQRDPSRAGSGLLTMDPDAFVDLARELGSYPSLTGSLAELRCPTTVLVGEHDHALRAGCEQIASLVPGARLVVMPSCGHSPQEDDPDGFVRIAREDLRR